MFWGKKKEPPAPPSSVAVIAIPPEFYAGQTPAVSVQTEKAIAHKPTLTRSEKKALEKTTAAGSDSTMHPATMLSSRKNFIIILGVVFLLGLGGAAFYYLYWTRPRVAPAPTPPPIAAPNPPPNPTPTPEAPTSTVTPAPVPAPTSTAVAAGFSVPALDTGDSTDSDGDGLTNLEDDLFKTDSQIADTDVDGYKDSHEVYNLYNPIGREPQKLSESGLVNNYVNPAIGYQVYYPLSWAVGSVDPQSTDVLFSTFTGEYIRVKVFTTAPLENISNFLARELPNERASDYVPFTSVFKESGYRRSDYLVYIWHSGVSTVVISYELPPGQTQANYRTVTKMMARSFRFALNEQTVPLLLSPESNTTSTVPAPATQSAGKETSTPEAPSTTNR